MEPFVVCLGVRRESAKNESAEHPALSPAGGFPVLDGLLSLLSATGELLFCHT